MGTVVQGTVRIQELALGDVAVVSGLRVNGQTMQGEETLIVSLNAGSVRLQNLELRGSTTRAARVLGSSDVALVDCTSWGGNACNI